MNDAAERQFWDRAGSYLARAAAGGEGAPHGVWVGQGKGLTVAGTIGGVAALSVGIGLLFPWDRDYPFGQAGLIAVGVFFMVRGARTWWLRRSDQNPWGWFVDGDSLWTTQPWLLRRLPLRKLYSFRIVPDVPNGWTVRMIFMGIGTVRAGNGSRYEANAIYHWLQRRDDLLRRVRNGQASLRLAQLATTPGGLAAVIAAEQLVVVKGKPIPVYPPPDLDVNLDIRIRQSPGSTGILGAAATLAVLAIFMVFAGPSLHGSHDEIVAYRSVLTSRSSAEARSYLLTYPNGPHRREVAALGDEWAYAAMLDHPDYADALNYLQAFPDGLHRREALERYDDQLYTSAKASGETGPLESYLFDKLAVRHRNEALLRIDDLKFSEVERFQSSDRRYVAARAFLQSMKESRHRQEAALIMKNEAAAILARVRESMDTLHNTAFQSALFELFAMATTNDLTDFPLEIHGIVKIQPDTDSPEEAEEKHALDQAALEFQYLAPSKRPGLIDPNDAFSPFVSRHRDDVIIARLNQTIIETLHTSLFKFVVAQPGAINTPVRIEYTIRPAGTMIRYHSSYGIPLLYPADGTSGTTIGLLRGYAIDWRLELRPKSADKPTILEFTSLPGKDLVLQATNSDPPWAAYAVGFYAEFIDFTDHALGEAGVTPPVRYKSFTFLQAVGNYH